MLLRRHPLALAASIACLLPAARAQADLPAADTPATRLPEVTVSTTRAQRRVDQVPGTLTVLQAPALQERGARDLREALRDEPDVEVRQAPTRFTAAGASTGRAGTEGINIRGLEGNQVLMLVDGIRLPAAFSFASFSTGRGDFLDLDGLRSVEILRGPASTAWGSDGLAGVVSFRSMDPSDVLRQGQASGGFGRLSWSGVDSSTAGTAAVARRGERWQGLLLGSVRNGGETANQGSNAAANANRTEPNPVDWRSRYLLGKLGLQIDAAHQLWLTGETQRRRQDTEVLSARVAPPLTGTSAVDLDTRDRIDRDRLSLEHVFSDPNAIGIQRARTRLYWQDAEVNQYAVEQRLTAATRTRDNTYRTRIVGLSSEFERSVAGPLPQRLSWGLDLSRTLVTGVRDGTVPASGETFPVRPFPDTRFTQTGAFVQDEILAGPVTVIPALRWDRYALDPSTDGYTGGAVAALSDSAFTPRLGAIWRVSPALAPYAQWARGFRAPTPDQVNNGFTNLASGYLSRGNANLRPERADSIELGVRGQHGDLRWSAAVYDNRYEDFITQQVVGGAGTPANPTVFQYVNLSSARIRGWEARGEWKLAPGWTATSGIATARGESQTGGQTVPLDTVAPLRAVLGLRWAQGAWNARAHLTHSAAKRAEQIAPAAARPFAPPAWTTLDLGVGWQPAPRWTVNANLNNVTDATYWRWSDVRGLAESSQVRDAYTAPGRNLQVSVRHDF